MADLREFAFQQDKKFDWAGSEAIKKKDATAPTEFMSEEQYDLQSERAQRQAEKEAADAVEVERSLPGEIGASVVRGAIGIAKLPVQAGKFIAGDVLGITSAKRAGEETLHKMEMVAESPEYKPSTAAGPTIDLDRILSEPGEVIKQIGSQVANPNFWAAQLPEGAMSMIPFFVGSWAPRAIATAGKLGKGLEAAQAAKATALAAGDLAKAEELTLTIGSIAKKIDRIGKMGGYGAAMAMEAGQGEDMVRQYEQQNPDKPIPWANKIAAVAATGIIGGGLEAFSLNKIYGDFTLKTIADDLFAGKNGGGFLAKKILDSVATEGITEGAQSLVENAAAKLGYDVDQSFTQGIVESVLVGAALGGLGGAYEGVRMRQHALRGMAERIRDARDAADTEATLQASAQGEALADVYRRMPEARPTGLDFLTPTPKDVTLLDSEGRPVGEEKPGPVLYDEKGKPISLTDEEKSIYEAIKTPPWARDAEQKLKVDNYYKEMDEGGPRTAEYQAAREEELRQLGSLPMAPSASDVVEIARTAPVQAVPTFNEQLVNLVRTVDETGDPNAVKQLNDFILTNRSEVRDFFNLPENEKLKPLAERLNNLISQVEDTGSPTAAKQLHELLSSNLEALQGVTRGEIARAAPESGPIEVTGAYPEAIKEPPGVRPTPPEEAPPSAPPGAPSPEGPTPPGAPPPGAPPATTTPQPPLEPPSPGVAPEAGAPPISAGSQGVALTARGTEVGFQYAVVEAGDLITSHDDSLAENPDYPAELQPRDRTRAASEVQVAGIANKIRPELLAGNPLASDGAPIVGPDNIVESGNARTIAIRRAYQGEQGERYKAWLSENAEQFGLDSDAIRSAQNPVLVRVRGGEVSPEDRAALAREFNERSTAPMGATERARADAQALIDANILYLFAPNEDGELTKANNATFIRAFMQKVIGEPEMYEYVDSSGRINQAGITRIRNAIFAAAYGDTVALEKLAESVNDAARNITAALTVVAPRMATFKRMMEQGHLYPLDLTPNLAEAATILQGLRENNIPVEDYLAQGKLFGIDPLTLDVLKIYGDFGRSVKKLTGTLNAYLDIIEDLGDPKQGQLLDVGIQVPDKATALQAAIMRVEGTHGTAIPTDLQQGGPGPGEEAGKPPAPKKPEAGPKGGAIPGLTPPAGQKPKSAIDLKVDEVMKMQPDLDEAKVRRVFRALPDAAATEAALLAQDDELFNQVAKGNLSATEREQLYKKHKEAQGNLPGLGAGGLFDIPPESEVKPKIPKQLQELGDFIRTDILEGYPFQEDTKGPESYKKGEPLSDKRLNRLYGSLMSGVYFNSEGKPNIESEDYNALAQAIKDGEFGEAASMGERTGILGDEDTGYLVGLASIKSPPKIPGVTPPKPKTAEEKATALIMTIKDAERRKWAQAYFEWVKGGRKGDAPPLPSFLSGQWADGLRANIDGLLPPPANIAPPQDEASKIARAGSTWDESPANQRKEWLAKTGWITEGKANLQWRHLSQDQQKALALVIPEKETLPPGIAPKAEKRNNLRILEEEPGAWHKFSKPFTDKEMELVEKAIDAGLIHVKKEGGDTLYRAARDLANWTNFARGWTTAPDTTSQMATIPGEPLEVHEDSGAVIYDTEDGKFYIMDKEGKYVRNPDNNSALFDTMDEAKDQFAKEGKGSLDELATPGTIEQDESTKDSEVGSDRLIKQVVKYFKGADIFAAAPEKTPALNPITSQQLFKWADDAFGGTQAEGKYTPKDAYDAVEVAVNVFIMQNLELYDPHSANPQDVIKKLETLTAALPTQTKRTAETDEFQQFSTPPPLAYVVNWVANIVGADVVLEPSTGTGSLVAFTPEVQAVYGNELSPRRAELLDYLNLKQVFQENAEQLNNILPKNVKPTVVLMNPPFSATAGRMEGKKVQTTAAQHIEQALKRLEPGGRLVAITGRGMAMGKPAFSQWWGKIKKEYNILANIGVNGKNYTKYGTSFDVQIIVIEKTGPTTAPPVIGAVENVADLVPKLQEIRDARVLPEGGKGEPGAPKPGGPRGPATGKGAGPKGTPVSPPSPGLGTAKGPSEAGGTAATEGGVEGHPGKPGELGPGEPTGPVPPKRGGGPSGPGEPGAGGAGTSGAPGGPTGQPPGGVGGISGPGTTVEEKAKERPQGELTDNLFEPYQPQRVKVKGAKKHPGILVQTAAMAGVDPPAPSYTPKLTPGIIENGKISEPQIEAVVYAGQSHADVLPSGQRRGFFIGDGTGVGKGREVAAIINDNWNQGRKKAIWISEKAALAKDAGRDIRGIGWDDKLLFELAKTKVDAKLATKEGILFTTYDTLKAQGKVKEAIKSVLGMASGKTRLQQIVDWFGKDFDGVIVFDEAHNMANARDTRGGRGTKKASMKALSGIELQKQLPNARIVYVSATGATEVGNLAYAERLGLWGKGTPFANRDTFINEIERGGVAAMEVVARDLKAMGSYISRSLAYEVPGNPDQTVTYERLIHPLSDNQVEVYDEMAGAWQIVLQNIQAAMGETGQDNDRRAKANAASQFWGTHQRFFNQVITAMQMPTVIEGIKKDLADGKAVLVQLTNTNEAAQERALSKVAEDEDLDGLDLSPREALMQYVENAFPTQQWEPFVDEDGNEQWRPVTDSQGKPVQNADAVRMKEELLDRLGAIRVPDSPMDFLINTFGVDVVAEATGRSRRIVKGAGETTVEKRSRSKVEADIQQFLDDKKQILIFSDMAGTGRTFNASYEFANQRKRAHYGVQMGWRADVAVQKMGRSHRSNQKYAPHYLLVSTDLSGQKRFISSIARRLDQLGALTKGQREAAATGMFAASDNLESTHARDALRNFYSDLYRGEIDGIGIDEFEAQTGLRLRTDEGNLKQDLPPVTQFLNRLLSMTVATQNRVFQAFDERVQKAVDVAIRRGTLNVGMETLRPATGGRIEKGADRLVYTEPRSGAETRYVEINEINPTVFRDFDHAEKWYKGGFYRNVRSGKVWARELKPWNETGQDGSVTQNYTMVGSTVGAARDTKAGDLYDKQKWVLLTPAQAKPLWEQEQATAPKEHTRRHHLITGTILPIWDRLSGDTRVIRTQTVDNDRFIGRKVPEHSISQVLERLGAGSAGVEAKLKPIDIYEKVFNENYKITLANTWTITRSRVAGEDRIEIYGPENKDRQDLRDAGVFEERIGYTMRYFIPVGPLGVSVVERVVQYRPVVSAVPRVTTRQSLSLNKAGLAVGVSAQELDVARKGIGKMYGIDPAKLDYIGKMAGGQYGDLLMFNVNDPGTPLHNSTKSFPQLTAQEGGEITLDLVQKRFPAAEVRQAKGGFDLKLPNGKVLVILTDATISKGTLEQLRKTYPGLTKEEFEEGVSLGEWRPMSVGGVIALAKWTGQVTLDHETFHAACDLVLTAKELDILSREFNGDWEAAARAYQNWTPAAEPKTLFEKILAFFGRIAEMLRPTSKGVFTNLRDGSVWSRPAAGPGLALEARKSFSQVAEERLADYEKIMVAQTPRQTAWEAFKSKLFIKKSDLAEYGDVLREWYDEVVDRFAPMERAEARALKAGGIIPKGELLTYLLSFWRGQEGWVNQAIKKNGIYHEIQEGGKFVGDAAKVGESLDKRLDPLRKLAKKLGVEEAKVIDDVTKRYMVAQRDLELAGEEGERAPGEIKGTKPELSRQALRDLETIYGDDFHIIEEVAGKYEDGRFTPGSIREWTDQAILQRLLQAGVIDRARYEEIKAKNQFYIPFKRLMDDLEGYVDAYNRALGAQPLKKIHGSERQIVDPLDMLMQLAAMANYTYARNRILDGAAKLGDPEIKEVAAKFIPVDEALKQEVDIGFRKQLVALAEKLGVNLKVVKSLRGKRLGEFRSFLRAEVRDGLMTLEEANEIAVRFATSERTIAHELGHALDTKLGLIDALIKNGSGEMRKELRAIADQRASLDASRSYKRYVRKYEEQVAEFVARYMADRSVAKAMAPETVQAFETILRQNGMAEVISFKWSYQKGTMEFQNRVWARSPLPPEKGTVPYYRNGRQRWLKLPPDMFKATQNMMPEDMGLFMKVAKWPADLLRAGAVTTPEFGLFTNPIRDITQAWVMSRFGFNPLLWFRDFGRLVSGDKATIEARHKAEAMGGFLATLSQSFIEPEHFTADDLTGRRKGLIYKAHPIQALRYVSAYLENLTRFSIYQQAIDKGLSPAEAIFEMRRTTLDFRRTGGHPVVRYLNMIIPFFNAGIQGTDKLLSELSGPNKWSVMRRLALLTVGSIGLWLLAHNDDRYKELENWERNYFWHIPIGGKDSPMLRIPKPFEAGVLFGSVPERMLDQLFDKNVGGVKSALAAASKALTPEIIPAFARPIIEGYTNYNWFLERPIEDAAMQNLPAELRSKPWTSQLSRATARLVAPVSPFEISPVKLEHFIRASTGSLGANYFLPGLDVALRKAGVLEDIPQPTQDALQRIPGVRALFTKPTTGFRAKTVNDLMDNYQTIIRADQGWKLLWNSGQMEQLGNFLADHPEAMYARVARKTMTELGKIRKDREKILLDKEMDSDTKKARLDVLDEKVYQTAKSAQAFMDSDVAKSIGMPPRTIVENGTKKSLDLDSYYKYTVESVGDAYDELKTRLPGIAAMDEDRRQALLSSTIKEARDEYKPTLKRPEDIMKPYRFQNLFDKPTRKEKATWQAVMGFGRIPPGAASGYRLSEE